MGNSAISTKLQEAYKKRGIENYKLNFVDAKTFYEALNVAKKENEYGAFVTLHDKKEYENMKLLLTNDKKAGIAITNDNNIVSVFKGESEKKNMVTTLLPAAIELGGNKLDNYNSEKLFDIYSLYGFIPVAKVKFDPNYAQADWDYNKYGQPDILFWVHNGLSASEVVEELGNLGADESLIKEFNTYDEAMKYRDEILEKMKQYENEWIYK